jgi:hypothetical protein
MHSYRRLAALAASVLTAAIMLGAATPASASVQGNTAVITQNSAPTTSASASYWYYYFTYFSLEACQAKGAELVQNGIATGYYCNEIYRSGYTLWQLWYTVD